MTVLPGLLDKVLSPVGHGTQCRLFESIRVAGSPNVHVREMGIGTRPVRRG